MAKARGSKRIEPRFAADGLRVGAGDRPTGGGRRGHSRKGRGTRRGVLARLVRGGLYWGAVASLWAGIAAAALVVWYGLQLPHTSEWKVPARPPNVQIVAVDGTLIGNRGDTGGEAVRLAELPPHVPQAVIAIEDRRFRAHFGLDPVGLARAMATNLAAGRLVQGGSTLTQQLAKNMFLTPERSLRRKVQEVLLALWLEAKYSKDEILEMYLNRVYFGAGSYGVDAAAHRYFDKEASELTLAEAAILAGLLRAPSYYAPNRNPERAWARAQTVLAAMRQQGFIDAGAAAAALKAPARATARPTQRSDNYIADWVMDRLPAYVGAVDRDIVVETTVDPALQRKAEQALVAGLDEFGGKYAVSQGALVAIDGTGAVRALVGGRNYAESQFNRAVQAKRQPGSAFKPFVYLAALEAGLTPNTIRVDAPVRFGGWSPQNYDDDYRGPVTLKTALALSLNTVSAGLAMEVGPQTVAATAARLGIESELTANASIALGTSEVSLLELTGAYAPFANGGFAVAPHVIAAIRTADGTVLFRRAAPGIGRSVALPHVAMMNDMLAATLAIGTGRKAAIPGWPAAGKTGTSQDFRDAWFVGYTANLTAGVWLGNDDNRPTKRATGGSLPATIWSNFMAGAHDGVPVAALPGAGIVPAAIAEAERGALRHQVAARAVPEAERRANEAAHQEWILNRGTQPPPAAAAGRDRTLLDLILGRR